MKSTVSLRSIPGTSTTGMTHHVKGYQKDISPDANIFYIMGQTIWRMVIIRRKLLLKSI